MHKIKTLFGIGILSATLSGCLRIPSLEDRCISTTIKTRIDKEVSWNSNEECPEETAAYVESLVQSELTLENAIQIALLNHPKIQAGFEELGITQANFIEATLPENPVVEGFIRYPNKVRFPINWGFSIVQKMIDFLLIPLRKEIVLAEFEEVKLRISDSILNLAFEVEQVYYELQAELTSQFYLCQLLELTSAAHQLSLEQLNSGNINTLEYQRAQSEFLEAEISYTRNQNALIRLREKMTTLLGLDTSICWQMPCELPSLPEEETPTCCLENLALSNRLDIAALQWEIEKIYRSFAIKRWWVYTEPSFGASTEKEVENVQVTGPTFRFALPFFNYGQAEKTRLIATLRQKQYLLNDLQIEALSQVRKASEQLAVNRCLVSTYQNSLLPLQDQILTTSETFYGVMGLNIYKLIDAKKQEIRTQIQMAMALRDYWISWVELNRALGGSMCFANSQGLSAPDLFQEESL